MQDLLILIRVQIGDEVSKIDDIIKKIKENKINLVVINNEHNSYHYFNTEIYNQQIGISNSEIIRNVFSIKLEQGYKYILNWPTNLDFDVDVVKNIYHQIKRGFDIVIAYNQNAKIQPGIGYKFLFKLLSFSKIKQPYSELYCFNWFVLQNFIKNERLLIEPSSYIFFHARLHLKILSLPVNNPVPTYVKSHGTMFGFRQTFKLIYYLLLSK